MLQVCVVVVWSLTQVRGGETGSCGPIQQTAEPELQKDCEHHDQKVCLETTGDPRIMRHDDWLGRVWLAWRSS